MILSSRRTCCPWRAEFFRRCTYGWAEPHKAEEIEALYRKFYAAQPMVRMWPAGKLPELQHVAHTNFCDIGFALDPAGRAAGGGVLVWTIWARAPRARRYKT